MPHGGFGVHCPKPSPFSVRRRRWLTVRSRWVHSARRPRQPFVRQGRLPASRGACSLSLGSVTAATRAVSVRFVRLGAVGVLARAVPTRVGTRPGQRMLRSALRNACGHARSYFLRGVRKQLEPRASEWGTMSDKTPASPIPSATTSTPRARLTSTSVGSRDHDWVRIVAAWAWAVRPSRRANASTCGASASTLGAS